MAVRGIRRLTSTSVLSECDIKNQCNGCVKGPKPNLLRSYESLIPYISVRVQPTILLSNPDIPDPLYPR